MRRESALTELIRNTAVLVDRLGAYVSTLASQTKTSHIEKKLDAVIANQGALMSKISEFAAVANAALAQANAALDNIAADEKNQAAAIQSLKDQIANSSSTLTPEDQAALDAVAKSAADLATRTQGQADSVPDVLPAPPSA